MAVLGFLIVLLVVATAVAMVLRGDDSVDIDLGWFSVHTDATGVFLSGAAAALLLIVGCLLLARGAKRTRRRRAEVRELRRRADSGDKALRDQGGRGDEAVSERPAPPAREGDEPFDSTPRDP